ncbi:DsbA family protein, partial [Thermodesulfobacteriota bacterium]
MLDIYPNEVKFVVKHFPLPMHKFARAAAAAALAADKQGKFWEFHHELFKSFNKLNDEKIEKIAEELKLDMEKFNTDKKSPAVLALIARDMNDGRKIGIRGTPTVHINGKKLNDYSLSGFRQ